MKNDFRRKNLNWIYLQLILLVYNNVTDGSNRHGDAILESWQFRVILPLRPQTLYYYTNDKKCKL